MKGRKTHGIAARQTWERPSLDAIDPAKESIGTPVARQLTFQVFQQIDVDDYVDAIHPIVNLSPEERQLRPNQVPVLRFYGVNEKGNSMICHVHNFFPYFYVPAPQGFTEAHLEGFRNALMVCAIHSTINKHLAIDVK